MLHRPVGVPGLENEKSTNDKQHLCFIRGPSGGMRVNSSSDMIRERNMLFAAFPLMIDFPFSPPASSWARVFIARPPSFFSPVWHLPQCVLRIGITSWTKSSSSADEAPVSVMVNNRLRIIRLLERRVNSVGTPQNGGDYFNKPLF